VGFNKFDCLFEDFSAMKGVPQVIDETSELIVLRIVTEGPLSCGIYLELWRFLVHQSFPEGSVRSIRILGRRMGLRDKPVEAIVVRISFLWNFVECRGWDTAIAFRGFCRTLPMR